jgi:hypothetical protein
MAMSTTEKNEVVKRGLGEERVVAILTIQVRMASLRK